MSQDLIKITDLEVSYHVGVPDAERVLPQRLTLTITLAQDFTAAAAKDDVDQTIDYFAVTQHLLRFGEGRSWKLIETLAVDIAEDILHRFRPTEVTVEVKKFIIREAAHVGVMVTRPADRQ